MKEFSINVQVKEASLDELAPDDRGLVERAIEYTRHSYAPYSHFHVGTAIALDNGATVCGSNQENAAFPSGTCAERTACFYAHSTYPAARFNTIAIAARGTDGELVEQPITPCGGCRQALLEYEILAGHNVRVILVGRRRILLLPSIKSLLPLAFIDF